MTDVHHWRTKEAAVVAEDLQRHLGALHRLDDSLAHYAREHWLVAQGLMALAEALGEPPPKDGPYTWYAEGNLSLALHDYVRKVRALTGLPKLVKVDVEEQDG